MAKFTIRIGLGRSESGKILDRNTTWHNVHDHASWAGCVSEYCSEGKHGKPLFIKKGNNAYTKISETQLLALKNEL